MSDSSRDRVRRWRAKKKSDETPEVTERNVTVTAQDTDTDTDTEQEGRAPSRFPPSDFEPRDIEKRQIRAKRPDLDISTVIDLFKATEYQYPRSDWHRAFYKFALTQHQPKGQQPQRRVSAEESQHPALVTERMNRTVKVGDL